jgi:hypothetical protein
MKLKALSIQMAAVAVILQCQMALGVIEERGELFQCLADLVLLNRFGEKYAFR